MPTLKNPIDKKSQGSETKGGFTNEGSSELERWKNQLTILRLTVIRRNPRTPPTSNQKSRQSQGLRLVEREVGSGAGSNLVDQGTPREWREKVKRVTGRELLHPEGWSSSTDP